MKHELVKTDIMLKPFGKIIKMRHERFLQKENEFTGGNGKLCDVCNNHLYFGLHKNGNGWILREWAPDATAIYIIGEFSNWKKYPAFAMERKDGGIWEISIPEGNLRHGDLYRLAVEWNGGCGERIPSHATRTVQNEYTKEFYAQVWDPEIRYRFRNGRVTSDEAPLIYEAHIGMSSEHKRVTTYREFTTYVLPRIASLGYNTIQLMAIQEHPYYGSFGYQVSGFYAASSRFGTPEELKELIDTAHGLGIRVIMDLVHSHAVSNETESLGNFAGNPDQYFHHGARGWHPAWKSRCFDYGKNEVIGFLLSNCKFWLEEYMFDGFRFDGVTSMLYLDHGLGRDFTDYSMYYDGNQDEDAIVYIQLANRLIHQVWPGAITIAEEMSGMPGLAYPLESDGMGFDYRLSMGIPDYWIKLIKERRDEFWHVGDIYYELTNKREEEKTISYAESHDQALVGDKTIFFRLADKEIYTSMGIFTESPIIERAMCLHKMIRLVTLSTANGGYLNFMGNEWGHPEWIDFPREGNGWSYDHARRIWSLADDRGLRFRFLNDFDREMIHFVRKHDIFSHPPVPLVRDIERQILVFKRGGYMFVFNFSPTNSYDNYMFAADAGKYVTVLDSDSKAFDGQGRIDADTEHFTVYGDGVNLLSLYLPARTAFVLERR